VIVPFATKRVEKVRLGMPFSRAGRVVGLRV